MPGTRFRSSLGLRFAHDVQFPARELAGQANVLTPRPMACESLSSDTAISIECESSSTTIEVTSAGAMALITNWRVVVVERNDVDPLAGDFVGNRLHA